MMLLRSLGGKEEERSRVGKGEIPPEEVAHWERGWEGKAASLPVAASRLRLLVSEVEEKMLKTTDAAHRTFSETSLKNGNSESSVATSKGNRRKPLKIFRRLDKIVSND